VSDFSASVPTRTDAAPSPSPGYLTSADTDNPPDWWDGSNTSDVQIDGPDYGGTESHTFDLDGLWPSGSYADGVKVVWGYSDEETLTFTAHFADGTSYSFTRTLTSQDTTHEVTWSGGHVVDRWEISGLQDFTRVDEIQPHLTGKHGHTLR
jgi:hypothetical protein